MMRPVRLVRILWENTRSVFSILKIVRKYKQFNTTHYNECLTLLLLLAHDASRGADTLYPLKGRSTELTHMSLIFVYMHAKFNSPIFMYCFIFYFVLSLYFCHVW